MRISDWSSDVCSSDLGQLAAFRPASYDRGRVVGKDARQRRQVAHPVMHCIRQLADRLLTFGHGVQVAHQRSSSLPHSARPGVDVDAHALTRRQRSEEHPSELQSLMRLSYAVFCLKKKTNDT